MNSLPGEKYDLICSIYDACYVIQAIDHIKRMHPNLNIAFISYGPGEGSSICRFEIKTSRIGFNWIYDEYLYRSEIKQNGWFVTKFGYNETSKL